MIGSPIDSWDKATDAAYYVGQGSGEAIWLLISIILCIVALIWGHRHEAAANSD